MKRDDRRERLRREAADWLARLRGPADEADKAAFDRWYADPDHAEAYDRVQASYDAAGMLAGTELGRARGLSAAQAPVVQRIGQRPYALAACLAALLIIPGALLVTHLNRPLAPARADIFYLATRIGEISDVPLPDGSRVTLDTATALRVEMRPGERHVRLQHGRVRFTVANEERPFVVEASEVRVTGRHATFEVALRDSAASVRPFEGAIVVESTAKGADPARIRLGPGQSISVSASGQRLQQQNRSRSLWPDGMLEFESTPLASAIAEANRYSRSRISLADPALAGLRVSGTFRAGDIEGLARSLEAALDLRLERDGRRFILHGDPARRPPRR